MSDGLHFDRVAETYDRGRPAYPSALWDWLEVQGVLGAPARALDVGAGSGQATAELLARGLEVEAVEPGPALAAALRARFPQVTVHEQRAEEHDPGEATLDRIVAATSLHWVEVPTVLPRWHRALRAGGLLAAWWWVFGTPGTPFRDRVDAIARAAGNHDDGSVPRPLRTGERIAELEAGALFEVVGHEVLVHDLDRTPEQLGDLFATFPSWGPEQVTQVVEAARETADPATGAVAERYLVATYVARPVTDWSPGGTAGWRAG